MLKKNLRKKAKHEAQMVEICCLDCKKSTKHYAKGLCRSCYKRSTRNNSPIGVCIECKKEKKIYLKNKCKTCYDKGIRHKNKNISTCVECKKRRVCLKSGMCKRCQDGNVNKDLCRMCLESLPVFAKNMCKSCYNKQYVLNKKKEICSCCNKCVIIHSRENGNQLCATCVSAKRVKVCSMCGENKRVAKVIENGALCNLCYGNIRDRRICSRCGNVSNIANRKDEICYGCYNKEYYQNPINNAKRVIYTQKRRKYYTSGHFEPCDWLKIMQEFNWCCFYCDVKLNKNNRTIDHIIPISKSGAHEVWNIVSCCKSCNSKKNNKNVIKWGGERILKKISKYRKLVLEE